MLSSINASSSDRVSEEQPPGPAVVLGDDLASGKEVALQQDERYAGLYVIGRTGTGKTSLLVSMMLQDAEQGLGLCFLDPHGDATTDLLSRLPENRVADVILLDPRDTGYPFGLNLFSSPHSDTVDEYSSAVMQVFRKLWGEGEQASWGPQLETILRNSTMTLLENEGYTMAEIPLLLTNSAFRERLVSRVRNQAVRDFWERRFNQWKSEEQRLRIESTLNKVDAFLTQRMIYNIVAQSETSIDFSRVMEERRLLLVRLPGRQEDTTSLLGGVIIAQLLQAALRRADTPRAQRQPFHVYADEYQRFATPDFATLLAEARKYAIATTIAHQWRRQLDGANRGATLNAGNMVVFRVIGGEDATELAAQMAWRRDEKPSGYVKHDVIGHLLSQGHPSEAVRHFIDHTLQPLVDEWKMDTVRDRDGFERPITVRFGTDTYQFLPLALTSGIRALNQILLSSMLPQSLHAEQLIDLLRGLCDPLGIAGITSNHEQTRTALAACLAWLQVENTAGLDKDLKAGEEAFQRLERLVDALVDARATSLAWPDLKQATDEQRVSLLQQRNVSSRAAEASSRSAIYREVSRATEFILRLFNALTALQSEPILTESGLATRSGPRTFTDIGTELANELANLAPYTARCKLTGHTQDGRAAIREHLIRTRQLEPGLDGTGLRNRLEQIQQQTRVTYCRPQSEVAREIAARQTQLSKEMTVHSTHARMGPVDED